MKAKFLSVLLALTMVLSLLPTTVLADNKEDTLPAADNGVITLNKNVSISEWAVEEDVTLDLNGCTFTTTKDCGVDISGGATLTIIDSGENGTLTSSKTPICVDGVGSKVIIKGGAIVSTNSYGIYAKNGGTAIVNGGSVSAKDAALSGNNLTGDMNFEVHGGTLTAAQGPAIYMPGQGELTITDGTLNGGISLRMGQVKISGGTINSITTGIDSPSEYYDYSGCAWLPDALYVFGGTYTSDHGNSLNLNITGGTFNCLNKQGSAIAIYDLGKVEQDANVTITDGTFTTASTTRSAYQVLSLQDIGVDSPEDGYDNDDYVGKVETSITGGTFTGDIRSYLPSDYIQNEDGTVGKRNETNSVAKIGDKYYATLTDAVAAAGTGDTVTLLADTSERLSISKDKVFTLDLGGNTLTHDGGYVLDIYGDLIIKNGTVKMTGVTGTAAIWLNQTAKLTVESDAIVSVSNDAEDDCYCIALYEDCTAAELTVKGTLEGGSGITVNGLITDANVQNKLLVDGATINAVNHGIYQAGNATTSFSVNNSTITGSTGIEVRAGSMEVNNSTITGNGKFSCENNPGGPTTNGVGIAIAQHTTKLPIDVKIIGGTISGTYSIYEANPQQNSTGDISKVEISISGGNFNGPVSSEDIKEFVSGGHFSKPVKTEYLDSSLNAELYTGKGDTPYSYYTTVEEAVDAAKEANGGAVTDLTKQSGQTCTVTLDYNDGETADQTLTVADGSTLVLPTPTRSGRYTFLYWTDGSKAYNAGAEYTITSNVTLTAIWRHIGSSSSSSSGSSITVGKTENGTITVSPKTASKGDTVTITVKPADGYELDRLTATDADGDTIRLTEQRDGTYTFTMPAGKVEVNGTFVKKSAQTFVDVPENAYYAPAVAWAVEKGVTEGTSATTFSPDAACTRAQIVTFLYRAAGSPAVKSAVNPFTDVSASDYYYNAVLWAVENGITTGTSETTFSPNESCTRGQCVAFLYRAVGSAATAKASFTDVSADAYYAPAVDWAVENGVTEGTSATTFSPDNACTRAQIVTFLYRAYQGK